MAIKKYIKGNILDASQKYIAHGVNCQNKMGSGVAKVLFNKYPEVKKMYHNYYNFMINQGYRNNLLGSIDLVECKGHNVFNCFTQNYYGYDGKKYVSYDAVYKCFVELKKRLHNKSIAIPKIGCGLAGGNWEIVSRIIDDAVGNNLDVYVYYLE